VDWFLYLVNHAHPYVSWNNSNLSKFSYTIIVYRHHSYYLTTMCRVPTLQFEGMYSVTNISLPDTNTTLTSDICGTLNHLCFLKLLSVSMCQHHVCVYASSNKTVCKITMQYTNSFNQAEHKIIKKNNPFKNTKLKINQKQTNY